MNPALENMLSRYTIRTQAEADYALREILQEICLVGIWRAKLFEHMAFYGGTALRILYGLDRFSEDLDFTLLKPKATFNWDPFAKTIEQELESYGFSVSLQQKEKSFESSVQSAFLKTNTLTALLKVGGCNSFLKGVHPQANLKIKVEVDTNPTLGFKTKQHYLTDPLPIPILTVDESDLFASKLHAALYRTWKKRVKGRDWYDLIWFIRRKIPLNFPFFKKCLLHLESEEYPEKIQAGNLIECILERLKGIDREALIADVRPFVKDPHILSTWDFDFFKFWIQKIEIFER